MVMYNGYNLTLSVFCMPVSSYQGIDGLCEIQLKNTAVCVMGCVGKDEDGSSIAWDACSTIK